MAKSSKRIFLGTYNDKGCFCSLDQSSYSFDQGLSTAVEDAKRLAKGFIGQRYLHELGICVAVLPINSGQTRIVAKFPFGYEPDSGMSAYERVERSFDAY
jgi:hypothetical protein